MKKLSLFLLAAILMIALSGCATIFAGSTSAVRVKGAPRHAKVYVNGSYAGEAPVTVKIPRRSNVNIKLKIEAENYKPAEIKMSHRISTGFFILDVLSGVVPVIIDFATGTIYTPYPNPVKFDLEPVGDMLSKFKVGQTVLIHEKNKFYKGTVTEVTPKGVKVKFIRPANLIEKQTKKVDKITVEKFFYFNEVKPLNNSKK